MSDTDRGIFEDTDTDTHNFSIFFFPCFKIFLDPEVGKMGVVGS